MADTIQLTPAELTAQADQMKLVYEQYATIFKEMEQSLGNVNNGWSSKLAHNFMSKISSVQSSFSNVLDLLTGGIQAAQAAASAFENVDSALARLFGDGSGAGQVLSSAAQGVASTLGIDPKLLSTLNPEQIAKAYDALKSGDFSSVTDMLFSGFTDEMKQKITGIIKDQTGLNVDPGKTLQSIMNGDISGALLDIADASTSIMDKTGNINPVNMAIKFLSNTARIVTDPNSYANRDAQIYGDRIMEAVGEGNILKVAGSAVGYLLDVPGRVLCDAAGQVVSQTIDNVSKKVIGVSVTEINDFLYDTIGTSPGHIFKDVTNAIGDTVHNIVSGATQSGALDKVVSGAAKAAGKFIKGIFS